MTKRRRQYESWSANGRCTIRHSTFALGRLLLPLTCCLMLAACGCSYGPDYPNATVSGMVTIDGKPVPKGFITFSPTAPGQGPVAGAKIVEGKYRCEKVPLGKHRVTFTAQAAEMADIVDHATGTNRKVPKDILPPQYSAGLEAEVKAGEATQDFPLQSHP